MSEAYTDARLPGGLRTGQQYLDAIAKAGRRIFVDGEEVGDVTAHPAFAETARTMASLFDISSNPANRDLMTYTSPKTGEPVNRIWQLPTSVDELRQRRGAIQRWAEENGFWPAKLSKSGVSYEYIDINEIRAAFADYDPDTSSLRKDKLVPTPGTKLEVFLEMLFNERDDWEICDTTTQERQFIYYVLETGTTTPEFNDRWMVEGMKKIYEETKTD